MLFISIWRHVSDLFAMTVHYYYCGFYSGITLYLPQSSLHWAIILSYSIYLVVAQWL